MFDVEIEEVLEGVHVHLIHLEKLNPDFIDFLDSSIIHICEGDGDFELEEVKSEMLDFLVSKKGSHIEIGAIAEFFAHLYLNEIGFKQECLFTNLEERSIKKGFDGFYSKSLEEWIMESKSGHASTVGITHHNKVKEAYNDLNNKLSGTVKNNPWKNAYRHANQRDVGTSDGILKNIQRFSSDFVKKKYHSAKEFNVIPISTIFYKDDSEWLKTVLNELRNELSKWITEIEHKKLEIICISNKTKALFWEYLQEG